MALGLKVEKEGCRLAVHRIELVCGICGLWVWEAGWWVVGMCGV